MPGPRIGGFPRMGAWREPQGIVGSRQARWGRSHDSRVWRRRAAPDTVTRACPRAAPSPPPPGRVGSPPALGHAWFSPAPGKPGCRDTWVHSPKQATEPLLCPALGLSLASLGPQGRPRTDPRIVPWAPAPLGQQGVIPPAATRGPVTNPPPTNPGLAPCPSCSHPPEKQGVRALSPPFPWK